MIIHIDPAGVFAFVFGNQAFFNRAESAVSQVYSPSVHQRPIVDDDVAGQLQCRIDSIHSSAPEIGAVIGDVIIDDERIGVFAADPAATTAASAALGEIINYGIADDCRLTAEAA